MNESKRRKKLIWMSVFFMVGMFFVLFPMNVYASSAVESGFKNILSLVKTVVTSIGTLVILWAISDWGLSFQGNDGMMQSVAFRKMAGGLIMFLAPSILTAFTG